MSQKHTRAFTLKSYLYAIIIAINQYLQDSIVHWQNIANHVTFILRHPTIQRDSQYTGYVRNALDMTNWGHTLTKTAIEHAELLRDAIQKRYTLSAKRQQLERNRKFVDDMKTGNNVRQQMTTAMVEQLQDVRIDINNLLFSFCQVSLLLEISVSLSLLSLLELSLCVYDKRENIVIIENISQRYV